MFASSSRIDVNVVVGPVKPGHIKSVLSSHLPILINYQHLGEVKDTIGSLWRMCAALKRRDRVREIAITFGWRGIIFKQFIRATNFHFPALESLILKFPSGHEPNIPTTFLEGPFRSNLRLRRLVLYCGPLAFLSGILLSVTFRALTDLDLIVTSNAAGFDPSQGASLLACLQGIQCHAVSI